jgi:hypothetical protein
MFRLYVKVEGVLVAAVPEYRKMEELLIVPVPPRLFATLFPPVAVKTIPAPTSVVTPELVKTKALALMPPLWAIPLLERVQ